MAEVEDVAGPSAALAKDALHSWADGVHASEQHGRIEIALNGHFVADALPHGIQLDVKIEAYHIAPCLSHQFQQHPRTGSKVNQRKVAGQRTEEHAAPGQHELAVV